MKGLLILSVLIAVAFASSYSTSDQIRLFKEFAVKFNKTYTTTEELQTRFEIFKSNLDIAAELDAADPHATYGVTVFMDIDPEEFRKTHLMPKSIYADFKIKDTDPVIDPATLANVEAPASWDWRSKGAITPVYNQAQCGSCWAFSATETIESFYEIAGWGLKSDSMQQIVSCDTTAYGCQGGWTYAAYEYVMGAGGIESYADYPYTSGGGNTGTCQFNAQDIQENIASWAYVTQNDDETAMVNYMVSSGPLSVCVDASQWQYYTGGVITSCGTEIDHCVQAVGYGVQGGINAWTVRNSWGTSWGLDGYLYVQQGTNMCAIGDVVTGVTAAQVN